MIVASTSRYDAKLSSDYSTIFDPRNTFNWLVRILEEHAASSIPPDRNTSVMDAACGVGSLCWRLARMGYREVVGVDLSASQIRACQSASEWLPHNLSFVECDVRRLRERDEFAGRFDVVNASWLYDTASDPAELLEMAMSVRHCLKPGGIHKGLEVNFDVKASDSSELRDYGVRLMPDKPAGYRPTNGERIRAYLSALPAPGSLNEHMVTDVTYFDEATYRSIFAEAGFRDVQFEHPSAWDVIAPGLDVVRLRKYVATNPEMIAFTAFV